MVHFYFGEVGQFYFGANSFQRGHLSGSVIVSSTMVRIGDKEVVQQAAYVAADDEIASFDVRTQLLTMRIEIVFTASPDGASSGSWVAQDGVLRFTFKGWSNALTTTLDGPEKIGEANGRGVYFQLAHRKINRQNEVHFWLMLGAAK